MDIRWLYPTAEARKAHAFVGPRDSDHTLPDREVGSGMRSLCRKYGRWSGDYGWREPDGKGPKDACAACLKKVTGGSL